MKWRTHTFNAVWYSILRPTPWLLWLESPHRAPLVGAAGVHPEEFGGVDHAAWYV